MKKHALSLMLAAILCTNLFACDQSTTELPDDITAEAAIPSELTVWLDAFTDEYMQGLLDVFAKEHPQVKIITEDYSDMPIPDYRIKLAEALMAGGGPDVLLVSNTANNTLYDLTKLLRNDVFLDIAETGADLSGCNAKVLKAGEFMGTQYLVPLNYGLDFLLTTEERLTDYGIVCDKGLRAFADSVGGIYDAGNYVLMRYLTTEALWRTNRLSFIDYDGNRLIVNDKSKTALEELAYSVNQLFPGLFTEPGKGTSYYFPRLLKDYNGISADAFVSGDLVFYGGEAFLGAYSDIPMFMGACDAALHAGETPMLISMPKLTGGTSAPTVVNYLVVNANSANRASAGLFIESAVGLESQYTVSGTAGIPVNNELIELRRAFYVDGVIDDTYRFKQWSSYPEQVVNSYFAAIDGMSDGVYIDYTAASKLDTICKEYAKNGDIDAAIRAGASALALYLGE
ncbi:MAG: extracellular solute-binding protein [Clostridia bacterium]|nr:extracellular solute-binding protein [Clostridia bacterium]